VCFNSLVLHARRKLHQKLRLNRFLLFQSWLKCKYGSLRIDFPPAITKTLSGTMSFLTQIRYVRLVGRSEEERFISKIANNAKEAVELLELGFEYVTGEYDDGGKIFKKRDLSYLGSYSISVGSWSSMD
jgi:hypothetical protein